MDPVGVLPRRSFTIRTENGVYRRISKEEMQALVRSRIQQARALAERRSPSSASSLLGHENEQQPQPDTPRPSPWNIASPTNSNRQGGRMRPEPESTAAFQRIAAAAGWRRFYQATDSSIQESQSIYDETPLLQRRFTWSSVEEEDEEQQEIGSQDVSMPKYEAMSLSETSSADENKKIKEDNSGENGQAILELLTESGELSHDSSAGERENLLDDFGEPNFANNLHLSPLHTTRPLPETPVYNNRVLADRRQGHSTSPKRIHTIPGSPPLSPSTQLSIIPTNSSATISPKSNSPQNNSNNSMTNRQKRHEIRQARVESLLRVSLNRVRDRARNELDQMLARDDDDGNSESSETKMDIQRTVSLTTREIDQVVQEAVQKARQAAQDEISELLRESVLRARMSAEQEILSLVQASVKRVNAHVSRPSIVLRDEDNDYNGQLEDSKYGAHKVSTDLTQETTTNSFPAADEKERIEAIVAENENGNNVRPAFMEMSPPLQEERDSVGKEELKVPNSVSGSLQSPLLISESLEEAVANRQDSGPWGRNKSKNLVPTVQVSTQPVSHHEMQDFFFKSSKLEMEWPYFEHKGTNIQRPTPRKAEAFPVKTFPFGETDLEDQDGDTTTSAKNPIAWHRTLSAIEQGGVQLIDGFPVVNQPTEFVTNMETKWDDGWSDILISGQNEPSVLWERKLPHCPEDNGIFHEMSTDISLGSEPPRAVHDSHEATNDNKVPSLNKNLEMEMEKNPETEPASTAADHESENMAVVEDRNVQETTKGEILLKQAGDVDFCLSPSLESNTPFDEPGVDDLPRDQGVHEATHDTMPNSADNTEDKIHQQSSDRNLENVLQSTEEESAIGGGDRGEGVLPGKATTAETTSKEEESALSDRISLEPSEPSEETLFLFADAKSPIGIEKPNRPEGNEMTTKEEMQAKQAATLTKGSSASCEFEGKQEPDIQVEKKKEHNEISEPKVTFRDDASLISMPQSVDESSGKSFEVQNTNFDDTQQDTVQYTKQNSYPLNAVDLSPKEEKTGNRAAEAIVDSLEAHACQSSLSPRKSAQPEDAETKPCFELHTPARDGKKTESSSRAKRNTGEDNDSLLDNVTQESTPASVHKTDSSRGDRIISPLSIPTVYSSDDCLDSGRIRKFTTSIQNKCSEGPGSPCQSLPNQPEIVGVFCTNIFDVLRRDDSYESQSVISLRTPSMQTFDASTLDDDNSFLTSGVETWMESVADRIEGHPPSPRQRRRRMQCEEQTGAKSRRAGGGGGDMKELSDVAKEWLRALGEKIDVAVDHINDVIGTDDKSESESEFEALPLLSEIKRSSFSFSDGGGGHNSANDSSAAKKSHPTTARTTSSRSSNKASNRRVPNREPMRSRSRQRGRSRQKRGIV